MVDSPKRRATDRMRFKPIIWAFIALTAIFFATLVGFAFVINHVNDNSQQLVTLVAENQNRIAEIQSARIESCEKTYSGIQQVFAPFFPQPPLTPEQKANLDKFNGTIKKLQEGCAKQTGVEGG